MFLFIYPSIYRGATFSTAANLGSRFSVLRFLFPRFQAPPVPLALLRGMPWTPAGVSAGKTTTRVVSCAASASCVVHLSVWTGVSSVGRS